MERVQGSGKAGTGGPAEAATPVLPKQRVGGSNPLSRSRRIDSMVSVILPRRKAPQEADAHPETDFQATPEAFLLSRRVGNCSLRTVTDMRAPCRGPPDDGCLRSQRFTLPQHPALFHRPA